MKKIITLIATLVITLGLQAQTLELRDTLGNLVTNQTITLYNPAGDIYNAFSQEIKVTNKSLVAKMIVCKRQVLTSFPAGVSNYFCWTSCYGPNTNVSPTAENINAGQTLNKFHGYANPNGVVGNGTVRYVFYDQNNVNDSSYVVVNFKISATSSINTTLKLTNALSNVFPNPSANGNAYIKIKDASAFAGKKIVMRVHNMLGKEVASVAVTNFADVVIVSNEGELPSGIYFVNIYADAKNIATKRFVIE
jgi:hypothetical protein